ncbi:MAG: two-component regulator propeller domain-containing protein, partial [Bacteroidota bacterium]
MLPLGPDSLLVGTNTGLWSYRRGDKLPSRLYPLNHELGNVAIRALHLGQDGRIYVGTQGNGLSSLFPDGSDYRNFRANSKLDNWLLDNHIRSITPDHTGNLWIGTINGLNRLKITTNDSRVYRHAAYDQPAAWVEEIGIDQLGGIYFYRRDEGLFYAPALGKPSTKIPFPLSERFGYQRIHSLSADRNNRMWIARSYDGIYWYDPVTKDLSSPIRDSIITQNRFFHFAQDVRRDNVYWFSSRGGLGRLAMPEGKITWYRPFADQWQLSGNDVDSFVQGNDGLIWLICRVAEKPMIGCFDPQKEVFRLYDPAEYGAAPLPNYVGRQATITTNGTPWFALDVGVV